MVEQDYIMRMIKEMVRVILKLLFNIDTENPTMDILENRQDQEAIKDLLHMIDDGKINEAENRLYEQIAEDNLQDLKKVLLFYFHLNEKSDDFLESHDFSREEIKSGLQDLLVKCGFEEMTDIFI